MAIILPPARIPWYIRLGLWVTRRIAGKDLLPPRLLSWYPKAAISSGILEALITHHEGRLDERLLKMVRLAVSFAAGCPFCTDMNALDWDRYLTANEMAALQGRVSLAEVETFSDLERMAVSYARSITTTPLTIPQDLRDDLRQTFTEREIVILATTAAQVNYWTRLIQALGCPPAGFTTDPIFFLPLD